MSAHPIGLFSPNSPEAQLRTRRRQMRNVHRTNPQIATWAVAATEIAALYPGAPAGIVLGLAQRGVSPRDPMVKEIMEEAWKSNPPPGEEKAPKSGGIMGAVGDFVGGIDDAVMKAVKPTIRTAFTAMESLEEEFTGLIRAGGYAAVKAKEDGAGSFLGNFWGVLSESGSTGRLALGDLLTGDKVDLGEGFFAGGELAEKQERLAERWLIDGNPISIGRVVANEVAEPGTTSYNTVSGLLDASVLLAADPAAVLLKSASRANKAKKSFYGVTDNTLTGRAAEKLGDMTGLRQRAGLVESNRKQVILDRANRYLDTEASDLMEQLAGADDFLGTYNLLGRKVRGTAVADIVDAKTPDEVRNVFRNEILEGNMRNKLAAGGSTFINRRLPKIAQSRFFDMMPNGQIDFDDLDDAVEQSRRWMANAHVPEEDQTRILSKLIRAEDKSQVYDAVVRDMFTTVERRLVDDHGVVPNKARGLLTFVADDSERMRDYVITELTEDAAAIGVRVNGEMQRVMSPMLPNQLLNRGIALPDPREIRKSVSAWAPVLNNPAVRIGESTIGFLQDQIWKRSVLLRGAWTVRVVGEEQVRIAASGGESLVNHPLSALAWIAGRKGGTDVLGQDFKGVRGAMNQAAMNEADDFANAMARGSMGLAGERQMSRFQQVVDQSDPVYFDGLVDELSFLSNDPVARRVARGYAFDEDKVTRGGLDGVKDWWWKSKERKEMATELPLLETRRVADQYIDMIQGHIQGRVGGSDELRNLIGSRPSQIDPKLRTELRNVIDQMDPNELPSTVLADMMKVGGKDPSLMDLYDRATEVMFNGLMSIPTNKLSRSPQFRQQYWQRIEELIGFADPDTAHKIIAQAKAAKLDESVIRRMGDAANNGTPALPRHFAQGAIVGDDAGQFVRFSEGEVTRWAGPVDPDSTAVTAINLHDFLGRGDSPVIPGLFGDIAARLDEADEARIAAAFSAAVRSVEDGDEAASILGRLEREMADDDLNVVVREATEMLLEKEIAQGNRVFIDRFDADLDEQFWAELTDTSLLGTVDFGASLDDIVIVPRAIADDVVGARVKPGLNLEHLDVVAKGHALDKTKELLYDLNQRSQMFDQMRLLTPFGEAWREVITRWAKIGRENPQVIRRGQQIIEGARDSGFFTTDEDGVETFVYSGAKFVTESLLGVPIESRGRVQGLSMMGEIMPGFGPAVQIPVAAVLPDIPEVDFIRDIVNPFGEPEGEGALSSFLPSWAQKWQTSDWFNPLEMVDLPGPLGSIEEGAEKVLDAGTGALRVLMPRTPEQQRLYMSTVTSTMDALAMTGEYDLHGEKSRDEGARLLEDAKKKARGIYTLRSMAQFVAPTAPSVEMMAKDPEGKMVVLQELADTFREYQDEDRDTAMQRFLADFGENAFLLTEGKTTGVFGVSKEVEDWARKNPDLLEKYPETYAFFGPTPPDDEAFDYDTYRRQIARGERIPRTPEEVLDAAQHRVAAARMDQFNKIAGSTTTPGKTVARDKLRRDLVRRYPGYRPFDLSSDLEQNIEELRLAAADPKMAERDMARSVNKYLRVRDVMLQVAHARGRKDFGTSNDTQKMRDLLRLLAVQLQAENPGFATVWERMLQYELRGREEEAFEEGEAA